MSLKSVTEDLQVRTLRAVSGLLGKLGYLAGLRQADGTYSHWGLSRIYGAEATQRALEGAHRSAVSTVLETPLATLVRDVNDSSGPNDAARIEFLRNLQENQSLPPASGAGTARHLSSVLRALVSLIKNRR